MLIDSLLMNKSNMRNKKIRAVPERLSQVAENYLLSLYIIREEGSKVTAAHLAEHLKHLPAGEGLGTTLPSVLAMLRRMSKDGLVEVTSDKEVKLTPTGAVQAEGMVRRHRLAEKMVVDIFGLELHKSHEEAHRLEHAISPDLESLINSKLGNPTTCPFGGPIPGNGFVAPTGRKLSLDKALAGKSYIVQRVPEDDQVLLEFLVSRNILPTKKITVLEASLSRGIIAFKTSTGEGSLGYAVASHIWVTLDKG